MPQPKHEVECDQIMLLRLIKYKYIYMLFHIEFHVIRIYMIMI